MSLEPKICANPDCEASFEPQVHNAIYCSTVCRKVITNKNVLDRYYEKKERRSNKTRVCKNKGCATILSIYNDENICEACKTNRLIDRLVSWGWDRDDLEEQWSY